MFRVVFDANVLFGFTNRDLIMYLALAYDNSFFQPLWSDDIHHEWKKNYLAKHNDKTPEDLNKTIELMNLHAIGSLVQGYQHLISQEPVLQVNEKDRHVLAAALRANANLIVTGDDVFWEEVNKLTDQTNITALKPDVFWERLFNADRNTFMQGIAFYYNRFQNPPLSLAQFLEKLQNTNLSPNIISELSVLDKTLPINSSD